MKSTSRPEVLAMLDEMDERYGPVPEVVTKEVAQDAARIFKSKKCIFKSKKRKR